MPDKLLTIFTAPKPFTDPHIAAIQHNALLSWSRLDPRVEVLLMGDEAGIGEAAKAHGMRHIRQVRCNQLGTPLISSMFELTRKQSESTFLAIVNTDILLFPDILAAIAVAAKRFDKFVLAGQRWDVEISERLSWKTNFFAIMRKRIRLEGTQHPPMGSDYFVFPRLCYTDVPEFAIGRAGWDNWMIFKARWENWALIDSTEDIFVAHQQHDYRHLPNGQPHYRLPESKINLQLAGGDHTIFTLCDANYRLENGDIHSQRLNPRKFWREVEILPLTCWHSHGMARCFHYFFHPIKAYQNFRRWLRKVD
jgi:hypothetical protein